MKTKYISILYNGMPTPIVFPPFVEHKVMWEHFRRYATLLGAGFIEGGNVTGRSESLDLDPHENDQELIDMLLNRKF
jgi:hypothetical protein